VGIIASPAHDRFENAVVLASEGNTAWDWMGLSLAGRQPGEPFHINGALGGSLWFRWTPTTSGTGRIRLPAIAGSTTVAVYTGSDVGALQFVAGKTVPNPGEFLELPIPVTGGVAYSIAVLGADPGQPASLDSIPFRVDPVAAELRVGSPVNLTASRFGAPAAEVTWTLNGEPLATLSPDPNSTFVWSPTEPGPFTIRATILLEGTALILYETAGWVRPPNDHPVNATTTVPMDSVPAGRIAAGTLKGASRDLDESSAFTNGSGTVWFEWTTPPGVVRARQAPGESPVRLV